MKENVILGCLVAVGLFYMLVLWSDAMTHNEDSRNYNICASARVSRSLEHLEKCAEYYKTGDIEYMRGK